MSRTTLNRLRAQLDDLKIIQSTKSLAQGIEVLFNDPSESPDMLQYRIMAAGKMRRDVLVINFIGPESGAEEGTGPITENTEI